MSARTHQFASARNTSPRWIPLRLNPPISRPSRSNAARRQSGARGPANHVSRMCRSKTSVSDSSSAPSGKNRARCPRLARSISRNADRSDGASGRSSSRGVRTVQGSLIVTGAGAVGAIRESRSRTLSGRGAALRPADASSLRGE
jgi:hypothetical protein